jgi:hypothetical protein
MRSTTLIGACSAWIVAATAAAQWNPPGGQWGKTDPRDLRVMMWNIEDAVCSTAVKTEGANAWTGVARIIAMLRPDILAFEEAGDNTGNGTGSGVDSVAALQTTIGLLLRGGNDPFRGGAVTAWVQKYAPDYDLPYVVVSTETDGFNRNVILSRYPFADINGGGGATFSNFTMNPAAYATGTGGGGIRGFLVAEIDLPDVLYWGDAVVGCSHLRSGSAASDLSERLVASQNIAYFIDYYYNGAGTAVPNPGGAILSPATPLGLLLPRTPVIWGGDWNEDEQTNGRKGPAEWMTMAATAGGTDGTDRDRSDSTYDDARDPFNNSRGTFVSGTSKFDYIAWQDSIAALRRAFTFLSSAMVFGGGATPPELVGWAGSLTSLSATAADHRPIVADFVLSAACPGDWDRNQRLETADVAAYVNRWFADLTSGGLQSDVNGDGAVTPADVAAFVSTWFASIGTCG